MPSLRCRDCHIRGNFQKCLITNPLGMCNINLYAREESRYLFQIPYTPRNVNAVTPAINHNRIYLRD